MKSFAKIPSQSKAGNNHNARGKSLSQRRLAAETPEPLTAAFVDYQRTIPTQQKVYEAAGTTPQRQGQARLQSEINRSPRVVAQAKLQSMVDNSPHQVTQRRQIERLFFQPAQHREELEAGELQMKTEATVRQPNGVEDDELLQGKLDDEQRQKPKESAPALKPTIPASASRLVQAKMPIIQLEPWQLPDVQNSLLQKLEEANVWAFSGRAKKTVEELISNKSKLRVYVNKAIQNGRLSKESSNNEVVNDILSNTPGIKKKRKATSERPSKPPTTVYHATAEYWMVEKIKDEGLKPRDTGVKKGDAWVCVSPNISGAATLKSEAGDVVLIIDTAPFLGSTWKKISDNEWRTKATILPQNIGWVPSRLRRKVEPRPLADYTPEACRQWREQYQ